VRSLVGLRPDFASPQAPGSAGPRSPARAEAERHERASFAADGIDERPEPVDFDFDGIAVGQKSSLRGADACGVCGG
jgi:hypothetical protein